MSATRKPEMSRAQKAIESMHQRIMDLRDATPMQDGSTEAEEKYLETYKKAYRESQSSTYFAAAQRYRLFLQGIQSGAPLQPGATQKKRELYEIGSVQSEAIQFVINCLSTPADASALSAVVQREITIAGRDRTDAHAEELMEIERDAADLKAALRHVCLGDGTFVWHKEGCKQCDAVREFLK